MTTYIANGFSPNMIRDNAVVEFKTTTKQAFMDACKDGKSIVGHPEIAEKFHVPLNRVTVELECGDTLYVVSPRQRLKTEQYEFISDEEQYQYKRIHIMKLERRNYD